MTDFEGLILEIVSLARGELVLIEPCVLVCQLMNSISHQRYVWIAVCLIITYVQMYRAIGWMCLRDCLLILSYASVIR